jgi:magnesium-transporting ATPase (P-type)
VVLPLSALLPQTRAYTQLSARRPPASLLQPLVIVSVVGQAVLILGFQLAIRQLTRNQCWWRPSGFQCCAVPPPPAPLPAPPSCPLRQAVSTCLHCGDAFKDIVPSYENTTLWHLSNFQYLWLAAALAIGRPFRQPQWTNVPFSVLWLLLLLATVALLFSGARGTAAFFELIPLPDYNFRWAVATLSLLSGLSSFALEAALNEFDGRAGRTLLPACAHS